MKLTEFQKEILRRFSENKALAIETFLKEFSLIENQIWDVENSLHRIGKFHGNTVNKSEGDTEFEIKEYIALLDIIESIGIAKKIKRSIKDRAKPRYFHKEQKHPNEIWRINHLIDLVFDIEVIPYASLKSFVENDFLTDAEIDNRRNNIERQNELRHESRFRIGQFWASIFLALLSLGVRIFFGWQNIKSQSNERKVTIKNWKSLSI